MRAINHALTGAVIGLTIEQPEIALPLSFISHYFIDSIPHSGSKDENYILTKRFSVYIVIDGFLCLALVIALIIARPDRWLQAVVCAFLAALPDLFSINRFYRAIKKHAWRPNWHTRLASKIQWFEKPSGFIVEVAWFAAMMICLVAIIRQ